MKAPIVIHTTWLLLGLNFACRASQPGITIRVLNPAMVPAKTLRKAERVAAAILDAAGVGITWLECPCPPDLVPNHFWLHLLKDRPPRMDGDATGFAVLMSEVDEAVSYAGVIWPAVEKAAVGLDSQVSHVLGVTVAHEIGHILLDSKAHTRSGIMCSRFRSADMRMAASGQLRFTPEQARRMQAVVGQTLLRPPFATQCDGLLEPYRNATASITACKSVKEFCRAARLQSARLL